MTKEKEKKKIDARDEAWFEVHQLSIPEVEYEFHLYRKWRLDYAWPEEKIALEKEGLFRTGGARGVTGHTSVKGVMRDIEKYNEAALDGWLLIRRPAHIFYQVETIDILKRAFHARKVQKLANTLDNHLNKG